MEPLTGVSKTALGMARVRARETARPDRLFADPYAEMFLAAQPGEFSTPDDGPLAGIYAALGQHGVLRTRFGDDYALATGLHQVVLPAAGLDTRAFRLPWPAGTSVFELDLHAVLAFKDELLTGSPRCDRRAVPADLHGDWPGALVDAGFDPTIPAVWLVEGLLIYLSGTEAAELLASIGRLSAAGSRLVCDYGEVAGDALRARADAIPEIARFSALWKGGLGTGTPAWLERHGWRTRVHDLAGLAARYGRAPPDGADPARGGILTAVRLE